MWKTLALKIFFFCKFYKLNLVKTFFRLGNLSLVMIWEDLLNVFSTSHHLQELYQGKKKEKNICFIWLKYFFNLCISLFIIPLASISQQISKPFLQTVSWNLIFKRIVTIMCDNDELSLTMSWVGCLIKGSELYILFTENTQILTSTHCSTQLIIAAHNCHNSFFLIIV